MKYELILSLKLLQKIVGKKEKNGARPCFSEFWLLFFYLFFCKMWDPHSGNPLFWPSKAFIHFWYTFYIFTNNRWRHNLMKSVVQSSLSKILSQIQTSQLYQTRLTLMKSALLDELRNASFFLKRSRSHRFSWKDPTAKESRDRVSNPRPHPRSRERIAL